MPQSMQRPACLLTMGSSEPGTYTSFQSWTRSWTGRDCASSRSVFRKPLGSAIGRRLHHLLVGLGLAEPGLLGGFLGGEHCLVRGGDDLAEAPDRGVPVGEERLGDGRAGLLLVAAHG